MPALGRDALVEVNGTAGRVASDGAYLRTVSSLPGGTRPRLLFMSTRLEDDALVSAAQSTECWSTRYFADAPGLFNIMSPNVDGGLAVFMSHFALAPRSTTSWLPGSVRLGASITSGFATDEFWGITGSDGSLRWAPWTTSDLEIVASVPGTSFSSAARRDAVVWAANDGTAPTDAVLAYFPADRSHVRLALEPNWSAMSVGLTATRVLWIAATGPEHQDGLATEMRLRWAAFPDGARGIGEVSELAMPATNVFRHLAASEDFVATMAFVTGEETGKILVAQLSSRKLWDLRYRNGSRFTAVLAVSDREIILGEADAPLPPERTDFQRVLRLETARLDEIEAAWRR